MQNFMSVAATKLAVLTMDGWVLLWQGIEIYACMLKILYVLLC